MRMLFKTLVLALCSALGLVAHIAPASAQYVTGLAWMTVKNRPTCQVLQADDGLNRNIRANSQVPMRGTNCPSMSRDGFPVILVKSYRKIGESLYQLDNGLQFNPNGWNRNQ